MMTVSKCTKCRGPTKFQYAVCWKCAQKEREQASYNRGYIDGMTRGAELGKPRDAGGLEIDVQMWRRLQQLCHPDKHAGSKAAVTAAAWLNSIREKVKG